MNYCIWQCKSFVTIVIFRVKRREMNLCLYFWHFSNFQSQKNRDGGPSEECWKVGAQLNCSSPLWHAGCFQSWFLQSLNCSPLWHAGCLQSWFLHSLKMDFQVKFRPMISHFEEVVSNSSRVLEAAKIMSLPCLATEQYPKGLGPTVDELGLAKHSITAFPKTCFTMVIPELLESLKTQQEDTK